MSSASSCEECGYSLRGLPAGQPCPECGHFTRDGAGGPRAHAAWARSVSAGLALLLVLTLSAVASVLVQPFEEFGGAAPGLNLPAPKLWAMPLLQRPIGRTPQLPGVVGTRTAMLSLLAVWLVTAPCALSRPGRDQALRLLTRWASVVLFAGAFGVLMAAQGLWPSQLPPYRLVLVGAVEMPAAILLYLYLRRLAAHVPGGARREAFARLVWLVPLVTGAAVALLTVQWWWDSIRQTGLSRHTVLMAGVAYGTVAVAVGVAATAAVASLCLAYFHVAFPFARRTISAARYLARHTARFSARLNPARLQLLAIAAGAGLLVFTMLLGLERTQWIETRSGVGGNLPFVTFPGPKFWATAAIMDFGARHTWEPLTSSSTLLFLNIAAIWLLTTREETGSVLRKAVRWAPIVALGLTFAVVAATRHGRDLGVDFRGAYYSRFYVIVIALGEVPATVLLYWWLSRVAGELNRPQLAWAFRRLAVIIVALVAGAFGMFVSSRRLAGAREIPDILLLSSIYAIVAIAAAVWAVASLGSLASAAVARMRDVTEPAPAALTAVKSGAPTAPAASAAAPFDEAGDLEPVTG